MSISVVSVINFPMEVSLNFVRCVGVCAQENSSRSGFFPSDELEIVTVKT